MTSDLNKGISDISYNHLNLPMRVEKDDGSYVLYAYDAAGTKLSKEFVQPGISSLTTVYVGGVQYTRFQSLEDGAEPANFRLDFIMHEDGRALADHDKTSGDYLGVDYQYNLTDHLGNVRVTVDEGGNTVQVDDYYPFGGTFNSYTSGTENLYRYNGKEEQKETQWVDFGARMFDAAIGRWMVVDPLADLATSQTPYHYTSNNPINRIDPDGKKDRKLGANEEAGAEHTGNHTEVASSSSETTVSRGKGSIEVKQTDSGRYGTQTSSTEISLSGSVSQTSVSDKSAKVVHQVADAAGEQGVTISSTSRNASDQARVMYNMAENDGVKSAKALYGNNGDQVLDVYSSQKVEGSCDMCTKSAMEVKITDLGPSNVSRHASDPNVLQVLDIAPSSVQNKSAFKQSINNSTGSGEPISNSIHPGGSEKAYHIEIPQ